MSSRKSLESWVFQEQPHAFIATFCWCFVKRREGRDRVASLEATGRCMSVVPARYWDVLPVDPQSAGAIELPLSVTQSTHRKTFGGEMPLMPAATTQASQTIELQRKIDI